MTLKIEARNFGGLVSANIEVSPIALLVASNHQGKTGLLRAASAALTGDPVGLFELSVKEAGALVHEGSSGGTYVRIDTDDGTAWMEWPDCRLGSKGTAPRASVFAAGLVSIIGAIGSPIPGLPIKERAAALEPYLKTTPTREDLAGELGEEFEKDTLDLLWSKIQSDGWDKVHDDQVKRRTQASNAWDHITGERFGSVRSKNWLPKGCRPGLGQIDEAELQKRADQAAQLVEEAARREAVDENEQTRLKGLANQLVERQKTAAATEAAFHDAEGGFEKARAHRVSLPMAGSAAAVVVKPCPHCGEQVEVTQHLTEVGLKKYIPPDAAKLKQIRLAIAEADGSLSNAQAALNSARATYMTAAQDALESERAAQTLLAQSQSTAEKGPDLQLARERDRVAREDLAMARQIKQAQLQADLWENLQKIIPVLAPTGLRQKKLTEALGLFNTAMLAPLCQLAGWREVAITNDFGVTFGGRRFALLSKSEQFRTQVILQVKMAQLDGSAMVLIDQADMLDKAGRNELFLGLLAKAGIPAVVAMTWVGEPKTAPNLAPHGLGGTWWAEDGTVYPLAEVLAEDKAA